MLRLCHRRTMIKRAGDDFGGRVSREMLEMMLLTSTRSQLKLFKCRELGFSVRYECAKTESGGFSTIMRTSSADERENILGYGAS